MRGWRPTASVGLPQWFYPNLYRSLQANYSSITSCFLNGSEKPLRLVRHHSRFSHYLQTPLAHRNAGASPTLYDEPGDKIKKNQHNIGVLKNGEDKNKHLLNRIGINEGI